MSYYSMPEILEDRTGYATHEFEDGSTVELTVHYEYHEWSEGHPYGDTIAYERLSEWEWKDLELKGKPISKWDLDRTLGAETVNKLIEEAVCN